VVAPSRCECWRMWRTTPPRRSAADQNGLLFGVLDQPAGTPFAPVAGLLVAAEGCREAERRAVDLDLTGAQLAGDTHLGLAVFGPDAAGEAELSVVGEADGLILVTVFDQADHRAEDLLAGDGHVVGDIGKYRGFDIGAAGQPVGPLGGAGY